MDRCLVGMGFQNTKNFPANAVANFTAIVDPHLPVFSHSGRAATVTVPHPMTPAHWITGIWVVDETNQLVANVTFDNWCVETTESITPMRDTCRRKFDVAHA
jgi:hypothetical protein